MSGESAMSEEQRDELDALAEICIGEGEFEVRMLVTVIPYVVQEPQSWFLAVWRRSSRATWPQRHCR